MGAVVVSYQQEWRTNVQVSLPLVNASQWLNISLANLNLKLAELTTQNIRQSLLLTVAQVFSAALSAADLTEVQRAQIKASKHHLTIASVRHRSGTGSRLDVVRAKTELIKTQENLKTAQTTYGNTCDALARLTGLSGSVIPQRIQPLPEVKRSLAQLIDQAVSQREDLKIKQTVVHLADKQLSASWMNFLPSLNAAWQINQLVNDVTKVGSGENTYWFIGLTLSVPIYNHQRYAQLDQARASLYQAQLEEQDAMQQATLEVRQALRNQKQAEDLAISTEERVKLAHETLKLAETAYESGTGTSLDVTDARRTLRQAQIDLATKRLEYQLATLELLRRVGQDMASL